MLCRRFCKNNGLNESFTAPFQTCKIKIGSWTYDGYALDVQPESYTMDISKSPSNLEWQVVSTSVERKVQTYSCCPEPYPDVTYTISIKRRQQSYGVNFIFPALFLTGKSDSHRFIMNTLC